MSDLFFEQLEIPRPHANLGVSGGSHAQQTAARQQPSVLWPGTNWPTMTTTRW